jgi:hypothetical protein
MRLQLRKGGDDAQGFKSRTRSIFSSGASDTSDTSGGGGFSYVGPTAAGWRNDDELDVRFYAEAPGLAAGQHSNLGPQLEALRLGLPRVEASCSDPEASMIERFERAGRASRVHRLLVAVGEAHSDVLAAAFGGDVPPRELRLKFGDVLGPVVLLLEQRGELRRDDAGAGERAETRLRDAMAAYVAAKAAS